MSLYYNILLCSDNISIHYTQGESKTILSTSLNISALHEMFEWNFTQPLNNKIYILSPTFVEIHLKIIKSTQCLLLNLSVRKLSAAKL